MQEDESEIIKEAVKARRFQGIRTVEMGIQMIDLALKWRISHEKRRGDNQTGM